ncbi:hypothetical protein [Clostridium sp. D53t1_180928_C8]|uniref:hypothetical protein n=1 Tax=Clostridium sp. D53t1_180928_C8 TaxID=2787101 RepID=UPI0018AB981B|nr:hypothetical protein [Clostridium sp. D53t1_180928_C8]
MSKENINTKKLIELVSKGAAEEVIKILTGNNLVKAAEVNNKKELSYYKKVEILLYNYENLKDAIKQKEEDIENLEKYGLKERSCSVVVYSSAGGNPEADRYLELKNRYIIEKLEIERDLKRIDNALDKIRKDDYFDIIKLKYLNPEEERVKNDNELVEILNKERITIIRNRKRLINKLTTILFPQNIREIL